MRLILYTFAFSQIACFRGLFSEAPRYLATEYVVDEPRIVAIQTNPMEMISGRATTFDTLLLAPRDATVESWEVSVCGLNTAMDTQTFIRDLLCFEQEESVSTLFNTTQMPTTFAVPEFPEIDCFIPEV